jgi:hypothetical protein
VTNGYTPDARDRDADGIIQPDDRSLHTDWRSLYLAEKQRSTALADLLKRRHALDPLEVAAVLDELSIRPHNTTEGPTR